MKKLKLIYKAASSQIIPRTSRSPLPPTNLLCHEAITPNRSSWKNSSDENNRRGSELFADKTGGSTGIRKLPNPERGRRCRDCWRGGRNGGATTNGRVSKAPEGSSSPEIYLPQTTRFKARNSFPSRRSSATTWLSEEDLSCFTLNRRKNGRSTTERGEAWRAPRLEEKQKTRDRRWTSGSYGGRERTSSILQSPCLLPSYLYRLLPLPRPTRRSDNSVPRKFPSPSCPRILFSSAPYFLSRACPASSFFQHPLSFFFPSMGRGSYYVPLIHS